jgi:hypothetical protein
MTSVAMQTRAADAWWAPAIIAIGPIFVVGVLLVSLSRNADADTLGWPHEWQRLISLIVFRVVLIVRGPSYFHDGTSNERPFAARNESCGVAVETEDDDARHGSFRGSLGTRLQRDDAARYESGFRFRWLDFARWHDAKRCRERRQRASPKSLRMQSQLALRGRARVSWWSMSVRPM